MTRGRASEVDELDGAGWQLVLADGRVQVVYADAGAGFMPASPGDLWCYVTAGAAGPGSSRERVLSLAQHGARRVARVRSEHGDDPAATSERDLVFEPGGVSPDIGVMTTVIGPVHTLATHGLFLPARLAPGQRWTWQQQLRSPLATMTVRGAATVIGEAPVTVPAGRFTAMCVRSEIVSSVVVDAPAGAAPLELRQRDDSHWVRGLGLVRHVTVGAAGPETTKLLQSYAVRGAPRPDGAR